jgi:WD40 repeat protein
MNRTDRFDDLISDWLHADAEHRVPEHLDAVLRRTRTERQHPAWSSLQRWLPMDTVTRFQGRMAAPRPLIVFAVLVALLLATMGVALFVGALRTPAPAFGLADNGRILVADGSALRSYAADGTDPIVVADLANNASDLVMSPDGRRLAMIVHTAPPTAQILTLDGGKVVTLPLPDGTVDIGSPASWSPDATQVTFAATDGTRDHIAVADADGARTRAITIQGLAKTRYLWSPVWSPDGDSIAFISSPPAAANQTGTIHVVKPDGTGLQTLADLDASAPAGISWAPDPAVRRLLLTRPGNVVSLYDVAAQKETVIDGGFWPTWSPDGTRISYWTDGTVVVSTADVLAQRMTKVRPYASFTESCQTYPALATKAFCGPASWSPDGTRVIAHDIAGGSVVSFLADGTGSPIVIGLATNVTDSGTAAVWQPIRK